MALALLESGARAFITERGGHPAWWLPGTKLFNEPHVFVVDFEPIPDPDWYRVFRGRDGESAQREAYNAAALRVTERAYRLKFGRGGGEVA